MWNLVKRVFEQVLVVGAHVQADGQAQCRIDARCCCVQQYLPLRNAHAATAQVTQSQHALTISHHHDPGQGASLSIGEVSAKTAAWHIDSQEHSMLNMSALLA
jgi:hypothetical protein